MHDINPLGTLMHLKELDRLAVPRLRPLPADKARNINVDRPGLALVRLLRRALRGRVYWQTASGK